VEEVRREKGKEGKRGVSTSASEEEIHGNGLCGNLLTVL
jgi:hypothetical protein